VAAIPGAGATSQLCAPLSGALAIQYDVQNGVPTTQLTQVPVIANFGGQFIHPTNPQLGFVYPPGWTPETLLDQSSFGVNLIRNDRRAIWRWNFAQASLGTTASSIRDQEVSQLLAFLGVTGPVTTLCLDDATTTPAPGITNRGSSTMIQGGGFTGIVVTSTVFVDGLPAGSAFAVVSAGPTAEIDSLIFSTFLPIHFQMLVGNGSSTDSDGDGVSDPADNFPRDPTRS